MIIEHDCEMNFYDYLLFCILKELKFKVPRMLPLIEA